jgi:hypothetical protein
MNGMNIQEFNTPRVKGGILGLLMAIMLIGFRIPPAFALAAGILFGLVVIFVLSENMKQG